VSLLIDGTQEAEHLLRDEGGEFLGQAVQAPPEELLKSPVLLGGNGNGRGKASNTRADIFATVEKRLPDMQTELELLLAMQETQEGMPVCGNEFSRPLDTESLTGGMANEEEAKLPQSSRRLTLLEGLYDGRASSTLV
jgi:hypothetical protein